MRFFLLFFCALAACILPIYIVAILFFVLIYKKKRSNEGKLQSVVGESGIFKDYSLESKLQSNEFYMSSCTKGDNKFYMSSLEKAAY